MQGVASVRNTLRRLGISAKKGLGQHFLADESVLDTIVAAAELGPGDTVVEVGPGLGTLTQALAKHAGHVIAIELDQQLVSLLRRTMARFCNVRLIQGDVLQLQPWSETGPDSSYKVVANLPYYIASAVLRHFLESPHKPALMVVTVQREVAEAIAAPPGKLSLLGVAIQYYSRPEVVATIPPDAFYPPPKVNSAILRLTPHAVPPVDVGDTEGFFGFLAAGFRHPRKQLGNSLPHGLGVTTEDAATILHEAGIDRHRRAGTLSIGEWAILWKAYRTKRTGDP
ncbi:MAG: 16S rRNA (adenine(1518)-N(6)/adenine(1519)-N(6))-dimethyltransferase RsmA [Chloroflexota bacterium]